MHMGDQPGESRPHLKRERYFINAGMQSRLVLPLLAVLALVALVYAGPSISFPGPTRSRR